MRVRKWVELSGEAEIEIDVHDVVSSLYEAQDSEAKDAVLYLLNRVLAVLKAITPEVIGQLSTEHKAIVAKILQEQAERYKS